MSLSTKGCDWGNVGDGLDFCHLEDPQIGLLLVELIERIMAGAEVLWQPALTSNGAAEHATECDPIDRAGMDAETNDPSSSRLGRGAFAPRKELQLSEEITSLSNR